MLASTLGVRLMLLLGDVMPVPAPREVLLALTQVEARQDADGYDGFALTFSLAKSVSGDYPLLSSGAFAPDRRVVVAVLMGVTPFVLADGVILRHQLTPRFGGVTTLTVLGRDLSVLMDREEVNSKFANQSDSTIVTSVLGKYSRYGITPDVTTTQETSEETRRITRQHDTDLRFVERLAQRNGFRFYLEPTMPGTSRAHWGPLPRTGMPQQALTMTGDGGASDNLRSFEMNFDALASSQTQGKFLDSTTGQSLPIPGLSSLQIPLAANAAPTLRTLLARDTAHRDSGQAALAAQSSSAGNSDPMTATAMVDSVRYGRALAARTVVGVRGVGRGQDGVYLVRSVTHNIRLLSASEAQSGDGAADYFQSVTLSREGSGALSPSLPI